MPKTDETLKRLHESGQRRSESVGEDFPPTWNPNDADHPNPITMAAFPPLQKPASASSYLIEATHMDGKRYTVWLSDSLLKQLLNADVAEGMPVSIHRSAEKHTYHHEGLGRDVQAWSWTVTTPSNENASVRGGKTFSINELTAPLEGVAELPPADDPLIVALQNAQTEDDIPF